MVESSVVFCLYAPVLSSAMLCSACIMLTSVFCLYAPVLSVLSFLPVWSCIALSSNVVFCLYAPVLSPLTAGPQQTKQCGDAASHQLRIVANICHSPLHRFQHFASISQTLDLAHGIQIQYIWRLQRTKIGRHFFPQGQKIKRLDQGLMGNLLKPSSDKRAAGPLAGCLALSHTFPPISYRLPCSSAFPPTGEKFENHQTAKWSKWPTICPAKLIWVVYLSRNV